ncbi:MAG: cupin domain-containing protein [Anaerolineae bacterium]|nr:cupin domain-containing protein [Anaerolineae bacterium]
MISTGDVLVNRASGDIYTILKTAGSTNGEVFSFHLLTRGDSGGGPLHRHRNQEERIHIRRGTVKVRVKNRQITARAGDTVVIPKNVAHTWVNDSDESAELIIEHTPALKMEVLFETLCAATQLGIAPSPSIDGILQSAVTLTKYPGYNVAASTPYAVQRVLLALLAVPGWMRGFKPQYRYDEAIMTMRMVGYPELG